jgi:diguanylate cyclase (GGDEF)-like protein
MDTPDINPVHDGDDELLPGHPHDLEQEFNFEALTILIIDDNPINLRVAVDHLEDSGFTVLVSQDGESGLMRAQYARPHLILLDVLMPGIDGFEICRRLKLNPITRSIPVIFMTALSDIEGKVKGFRQGAVDYVTKPIHGDELFARITTHLRLQALTQQLQHQNKLLEHQTLELRQAKDRAELISQELHRLANLDGLTQIANRRRFDDYLQQEWHRLAREQAPLSLILADIDYFKRYNDDYGHQAGDTCLIQVAQTINRVAQRPADLVARYGGEEFVIVLSRTDLQGAVQMAARIQASVQQLQIPHRGSEVGSYVTLSLGISSQIPNLNHRSESLISAADQQLYQAKQRGRNLSCYECY